MATNRGNETVNNLKRTGYGGYTPGWLVGAVALLLVLALLALFTACSEDKPAPGADVTAGRIIENPAEYVGRTLTVSGDVENVYGPRAFAMDSGVQAGELLVLGAEPFPQVSEGGGRAYVVRDNAKVTGTVVLLVSAEVERELGWDLDRQLEVEYEGKPVLIAKTATMTAGRGAATGASPQGSPAQGAAAGEPITDVLVIVAAPDRPSLVGKRVQLTDVPVRSVVSDRGFWVGPSDGQRMFVRLDEKLDKGGMEQKLDVNKGQARTITGVIRELPSAQDIQRQWGLESSEAAALKGERIYLHAENFESLR